VIAQRVTVDLTFSLGSLCGKTVQPPAGGVAVEFAYLEIETGASGLR
jgi:hypothetical protein